MRTTVDLDTQLLKRARKVAAEQGQTLSGVLGDALAAYLGSLRAARGDPPFELLVRGNPSGRFPQPDEIAAIQEEEEAAALGLPRGGRDAPS